MQHLDSAQLVTRYQRIMTRTNFDEITSSIKRARKIQKRITSQLEKLSVTTQKETVLMQAFVVSLLEPRYHNAAQRLFTEYGCSSSNNNSNEEEDKDEGGENNHHKTATNKKLIKTTQFGRAVQTASLLILLSIAFGGAFLCFTVAAVVGTRSIFLWASTLLLAILFDSLLLKSLAIFLQRVILANVLMGRELVRIVTLLRRKARIVLRRSVGVLSLRNFDSPMQHFNPACRVARSEPHLAISRLLIMLNDGDVCTQRSYSHHNASQSSSSSSSTFGGGSGGSKWIHNARRAIDYTNATIITAITYPPDVMNMVLFEYVSAFLLLLLLYTLNIVFLISPLGGLALISLIILSIAGYVISELWCCGGGSADRRRVKAAVSSDFYAVSNDDDNGENKENSGSGFAFDLDDRFDSGRSEGEQNYSANFVNVDKL
jgi:hypothetical protein